MLKIHIIIITVILLISANSLLQTVPGLHLGIFSLIKMMYISGVMFGMINSLELITSVYLGDKPYQELLTMVLDSTTFKLVPMLF